MASEEDSEKRIQPSIRKRRGDEGYLGRGFDRAFPRKVPRLPAAVTVDFTRFAAVDGHVAGLPTPVTFHLGAVLLDVPKLSARIALLFIGVVTITGKVPRLATVVAALLPLFPWLLAVLGDVPTSATVIASILLQITILSKVARLPTAVADVWKR